MAGPSFHEREDQQLGAAFLELSMEHAGKGFQVRTLRISDSEHREYRTTGTKHSGGRTLYRIAI
jgi:hypothetical protein